MPGPPWQAARNGLPGDANAVDKSAQINQLLVTHPSTELYAGNAVVTPNGSGLGTADPNNYWSAHLDAFDYDQPFTASGTVTGRVTIPVLPVGAGADLRVSLCADNAGSPGTVIASTRIPAAWIRAFAGVAGIPTSQGSMLLTPTPGPLALPQFNVLRLGAWSSTNWQSPAVGSAGGAGTPSVTANGNYLITMGGTSGGATVANVYTVAYGVGAQLGATTAQPSLPLPAQYQAPIATSDTLVCAGGYSASTWYANVYTASWNPNTGAVGAWSSQQSLPQALSSARGAAYGATVYVVGGNTSSNTVLSTVYYATIQNGQIQSWTTGPSMPVAAANMAVAVIGNLLVVAGGTPNNGVSINNVYYIAINPDGSLAGSWQQAQSLPVGVAGYSIAAGSAGLVIVGGYTSTATPVTTTGAIQSLAVGSSGPGQWSSQHYNSTATNTFMVPTGPGQWQLFVIYGSSYNSATVYSTPQISVPLPAAGLTNGAAYHILLQQQGGDFNNYLRTALDYNALPGNPTALYGAKGGSSWSSYSAGWAIPITVYDQTQGGQPLHTWDDNGARISTLVYATTGDKRLLGLAEATQFADGTMFSDVVALTYPGTWPNGAWPPLGVTQLA